MVLGFLGFVSPLGCITQDVGSGLVGEAEIVGDVGAILDLEENHGRGNEHASEEQAPARGEFGHIRGLLGVHTVDWMSKSLE